MTAPICDLSQKHCKPCEGGVEPLSKAEAEKLLTNLKNWQLSDDGKSISLHLDFKGFNKTMGFINALAWIANSEMHHPDVSYGYNFCEVTFTTHAINGLSENDFICASKVDQLFS